MMKCLMEIYFPSDGSEFVVIDRWSGDVQLKRGIGFEDSNFTFSVKISDSANPPHDVTEVITVQVVSDDSNQLNFDNSFKELSIDEASAMIGAFVGSVALPFTGSNGSNLNYFTAKASTDQFPFYINVATGDVFVTGPVNATLKSTYEVDVDIGSDEIPPQTSHVVIKIVGEGSSEKPNFPTDPIFVRVPENSRIGTRILTLSPDDKSKKTSASWPLKFEIVETSPQDSSSFDINEKTGEVKLIKTLDFEKVQSHLLTVKVSGSDHSADFQFSTLLTVVVVVEDVNDFQPTFLSTGSVEISSDIPLNRPFFNVFAADEDSGDAGIVRYSIRDGNVNDVFAVDEKSGEVSMKKLPSNGQTTFKLTIRAEDSGKLFAEQVLRIDVRQDSTLAPKFVDKKMTLLVSENLPPISRVASLQVQ